MKSKGVYPIATWKMRKMLFILLLIFSNSCSSNYTITLPNVSFLPFSKAVFDSFRIEVEPGKFGPYPPLTIKIDKNYNVVFEDKVYKLEDVLKSNKSETLKFKGSKDTWDFGGDMRISLREYIFYEEGTNKIWDNFNFEPIYIEADKDIAFEKVGQLIEKLTSGEPPYYVNISLGVESKGKVGYISLPIYFGVPYPEGLIGGHYNTLRLCWKNVIHYRSSPGRLGADIEGMYVEGMSKAGAGFLPWRYTITPLRNETFIITTEGSSPNLEYSINGGSEGDNAIFFWTNNVSYESRGDIKEGDEPLGKIYKVMKEGGSEESIVKGIDGLAQSLGMVVKRRFVEIVLIPENRDMTVQEFVKLAECLERVYSVDGYQVVSYNFKESESILPKK